VWKSLCAIFGHYEINWSQVILDEFQIRKRSSHENVLYPGMYLTHIFEDFGFDFKGEEYINRKVLNNGNISLMKISPIF